MRDKATRKRFDPELRADMILDVALQLFAEQHYNAVSVRDIAQACGINPGLIYYYFDSKDQLLRRVLSHAIGQMHEGGGIKRRPELNPLQELLAYLHMQVPIAPMLISMVKIMADYSASKLRDAATDKMISDFYAREQEFLEDCLHRGITAGIIKPINIADTARAISLQLDGIFYAAKSRGDDRIQADIANLCALLEMAKE